MKTEEGEGREREREREREMTSKREEKEDLSGPAWEEGVLVVGVQ